MQEIDILITGSLVGNDLIMAEHLSRKGLNVVVARYRDRPVRSTEVPSKYYRSFDLTRVAYVNPGLEYLKLVWRSKLLLSISGTLVPFLGKLLWPIHRLLRLPPVINLATGSDMTELAMEHSLRGMAHRQYLRYVDLNWLLPLPHALKNAIELRLSNVVFMNGFPYILPTGVVNTLKTEELKRKRVKNTALHLFHCSNLDWGFTNFNPSRNSTKGNQKFLRAYIQAVQSGLNVELVILDRGPDRKVAKEMLARARVDQTVSWRENMTREELYDEMLKADVVINMFAHGGAGGISFEAMALGTPVMQHADENYFRLLFGGNPPPIINCRTEEQILEKLVWCENTNQLSDIGRQSQEWVSEHVDPDKALTKFLFYYSLLTGDINIDLGTHIMDTETHVANMLAGKYDPFENL